MDEAAELRNRADKMRAYAKQKKDHELHAWMGEIFCRATIQYGALSKAMPKAKVVGGRGGKAELRLPTGGTSKRAQIKDSGLSKSAAQRAEALAGGRNDLNDTMAVEALGISLETAEIYYQQCRKQKTTPNQRQPPRSRNSRPSSPIGMLRCASRSDRELSPHGNSYR